MFGELAEGIAGRRTLCATEERHFVYVGALMVNKSRREVAMGVVEQDIWRKEATTSVFLAEVDACARTEVGTKSPGQPVILRIG